MAEIAIRCAPTSVLSPPTLMPNIQKGRFTNRLVIECFIERGKKGHLWHGR